MTTLRITAEPTAEMRREFNIETDSWETEMEQFIADNDLDDEEADIIRTNPIGVGYHIGGGAGPLFTVTRIA